MVTMKYRQNLFVFDVARRFRAIIDMDCGKLRRRDGT
jgi:hypothetical protein